MRWHQITARPAESEAGQQLGLAQSLLNPQVTPPMFYTFACLDPTYFVMIFPSIFQYLRIG